MKKQNESSSTIIFQQQNPPIKVEQQQEQLQIYCVSMPGKKVPNYTRTHTSEPSQQNPVYLSVNQNRYVYVGQQSKNQIDKQGQDQNGKVVEDKIQKQQNNMGEVKQIITNLITVKSVPRIKNRSKIRIKLDSNGSQINNQIQNNDKQKKQRYRQKQQEQDEDKSQTSSNRQTKPTKTIQQPELSNQDFSYQIKINYSNPQYKSYDNDNLQKQKYNHIIPCNAQRQLGNQHDQNQYKQKQEEEVQSQQDEQYSQAKYLQQMKIYNQQKKRMKNQKLVSKPPSLQIKFGQSMQQKFITTPMKPGFQFQSIITIESGIFGVGNKYHLNQKFQSNILISAKKQIMSLSSCFILSLDKNNHSRRHQSFIGIMESNFSGTIWNLFCPILSSRFNEGQVAHDLISTLSATYISSVLGSKSTRDMNVYFIDPSLSKKQSEKIRLQDQIKTHKKKYLVQLQSAKPTYAKGKYQLDFKGIAKMPSNKNFILENKNENSGYCLAFAKKSENTYQMNIRYPLSLIQGFALCLASLDNKLFVN